MPDSFCSQCGAILPPGVNFCEQCGQKVETVSPHAPASVPESLQTVAPAPVVPPPLPPKPVSQANPLSLAPVGWAGARWGGASVGVSLAGGILLGGSSIGFRLGGVIGTYFVGLGGLLASFLALAIGVGVSSAFLWRKQLPRPGAWAVTTALGFLLAVFLSLLLPALGVAMIGALDILANLRLEMLALVVGGVLVGASSFLGGWLIGRQQAHLLRLRARHVKRWLSLGAVGWAGAILGTEGAVLLTFLLGLAKWPLLGVGLVVMAMLGFSYLFYGVLTGIGVQGLLKKASASAQ